MPNTNKQKKLEIFKRKLVTKLSQKIDKGELTDRDYEEFYELLRARGYKYPQIFFTEPDPNKEGYAIGSLERTKQNKDTILQAYRYWLNHHHEDLIKHLDEQKTQFGTLTKKGLVNVLSVDLNAVKSSDPLAYSFGYMEGKNRSNIDTNTPFNDFAEEFLIGYAKGRLDLTMQDNTQTKKELIEFTRQIYNDQKFEKDSMPKLIIKSEQITIPMRCKVWESGEYDNMNNYAQKLGYKIPDGAEIELSGWIPTMGDSTHDPERELNKLKEQLQNMEKENIKFAIGFCQTGNFSIGYTIYVKPKSEKNV